MSRRIYLRSIIAILLLVLIAMLCIVINTGFSKKYKEKNIEFTDLIENSSEIKDFEEKDGILSSKSDDPWILYSNTDIENIKTINIYVDYLSENYTKSEIFIMYENGGLSRYEKKFELGENIIDIYKKSDNISSIRFDLLVENNQKIGIRNICINDKDSLYEALAVHRTYLISVLFNCVPYILPISALILITYIVLNIKLRENKIRTVVISGFFSFVIAIICFCFMIFGADIIYSNNVLSFDEFIDNQNNTKDFDVNGNVLISTSNDPWVYCYYNKANTVRTITINVNSLSTDYTESELFVFYGNDEDKFELIPFKIREGENNIIIPKYLEKINYFRFDLVTKRDIQIEINNIEFNNPKIMKPVVRDEILNLFSKIIVWMLFISTTVIMVILGRRTTVNKKLSLFVNAHSNLILTLMSFIMYCLGFYFGIISIIAVALISFFIGKYSNSVIIKRKSESIFSIIVILLAILFMYIFIPDVAINRFFVGMQSYDRISIIVFLAFNYVLANTTALVTSGMKENDCKSGRKLSIENIISIIADYVIIFVMTVLIEVLVKCFINKAAFTTVLFNVINSDTLLLSILLVAVIYYFIKSLFGEIIGRILAILFYLFFFIGNYVKLKFHDTVFKPMDILQISDFFSIVTRYIHPIFFYGCIIVLLLLAIYLIYVKRNTVIKYKPNIWCAVVSIIVVFYFAKCIEDNKFIDMGINSEQLWEGTESCVNQQGIVCYSYIEFAEITKIYPKATEDYSEKNMLALKEEFDFIENNNNSTDVKPDVILIMEESLFDVTVIPEVNFSIDVSQNLKKFKKGNVISPKYGGGTASVEFEALTGMSNFFFLDNVVPYVTYWNNENKDIPGLAEEFNNNGYNTVAIHPNDGNIYNRNVVYNCMQFDKFLEKEDMDFSEKNITDDSYFKDNALADVIEDELDKSTNEPNFIFAVTIENHTLYRNKYSKTELKLSSDKLEDSELRELEQYSEGVLNADRFIEKMINIVDNADRPTILYIWGDHLPSLSAFNTLGFKNNKYNKYSTPLIAYSNYKNIEIGQEYITPNQIAPQILRDAEINYSSYFDFIYSLREKYPVIQKEFGVDPNDELIKKYQEVQYDLLFGNKYLLSDK